MKIYLAGPMRGIHMYNWEEFYLAQKRLEKDGHEIVNPHQLNWNAGYDIYDIEMKRIRRFEELGNLDDSSSVYYSSPPDNTNGNMGLNDVIIRDVEALLSCEAIYMLPGWHGSLGASAEFAVAEWAGLTIMGDVQDF